MPSQNAIQFTPEVEQARSRRAPIVALESSVFAQGLPIPANAEALQRMTSVIVRAGGVPAIAAVVGGTPTWGLTEDEQERFLARSGISKASARDLGVVMAEGRDAATTVAATLVLGRDAGLSVFATGGVGGVHRGAFDESADLLELSRTSAIVVCSGAKSVLDLPATNERLESLSIPVVGFRTDELPGFLFASTGIPVTTVAEDVNDVVTILLNQRRLGMPAAVLVVQPPPADAALPRDLVEEIVAMATDAARSAGVHGALLTPFLLAAIERETGGRSVHTNVALLESNAKLAAEIAVALARWEPL